MRSGAGDVKAMLTEAADAVMGLNGGSAYVSKFGRAKSYGAKTIGTPDAGAVSMAKFLRGLQSNGRKLYGTFRSEPG